VSGEVGWRRRLSRSSVGEERHQGGSGRADDGRRQDPCRCRAKERERRACGKNMGNHLLANRNGHWKGASRGVTNLEACWNSFFFSLYCPN
jgi:hypothetical protein